jgi:hypothetical protein
MVIEEAVQITELKLKQASAVLGVPPKDLQNLVQNRVIQPRRRAGLYYFDRNTLLQAKVVTYLKGSLDASTAYLSKFTKAIAKLPDFASGQPAIVLLKAKFYPDEPPLMVMIPLGALAAELERRLPLADLAKDLPRGRKRPGWKRAFLKTLWDASADLEGVSEKQILDAIRKVRTRRNKPELTVVAEAAETATA